MNPKKLSDKKIRILKKVNRYSYFLFLNKSKIKQLKDLKLSKRRSEKNKLINQINELNQTIENMFKDDTDFLQIVKNTPGLKQIYNEQQKIKLETDILKREFSNDKIKVSLGKTSILKGMNLGLSK